MYDIPTSWIKISFDDLAPIDRPAIKAGPFGSSLKKKIMYHLVIRFMAKSKLLLAM